MMAFFKLPVALLLLLLGQTTVITPARAQDCNCAASSVCANFANADVVLRGKVILASAKRRCTGRRCKGSPKGSIVFIVEVVEVFKGEPGLGDEGEIVFLSEDRGDGCRDLLIEGEEYLLDLFQTGEGLVAGPCSLAEEWTTLREGDKAAVEGGCADDTCNLDCDEFQECLLHDTKEYYCADVCDPSPCAEDQVCSFAVTTCTQDPCPQPAMCTTFNT